MSRRGVFLCSRMMKNEKLKANIINPTTKVVDHDLPISRAEVQYIISLGFLLTKCSRFRV